MKSLRSSILILLFLCLTGTAWSIFLPTDYYVDGATGSNTNDGSSGSPWQTIQYALNTCVSGDIIHIAAGTYTEALTINKSITLIGSGPDTDPTTIITSTSNPMIALTVTGNSYTFSNLIIEGNVTNNGIRAGGAVDINTLTISDAILRNCQVALYLAENWPSGGPFTTTVSNLYMDNITVTNNKFIGVYIGKTVLNGSVVGSTFSGNGYSDDLPSSWQKTGLQFVNFDEASVPHVVVSGCTFDNNGVGASNIERTGLILYTAYNAYTATDLMTVSTSTFSNHPLYAVRIKNGYKVNNTATVNGTFTNNTLDIWFNNVIGSTTSTTLVRRTFLGVKTVGAGYTYDYNTIQAAINAAATNDIITVAPGNYDEALNINKTVTLRGQQSNVSGFDVSRPAADESIITRTVAAASGGVYISANGVVLDGFIIDKTAPNGSGAGIVLAPTASGYIIKNNIIRNNTMGLSLASEGTTQTEITNNYFLTNNVAGSASGDGIYGDQRAVNILIDNNKFESNNAGGMVFVSTIYGPYGPLSQLTLSNNTVIGKGFAVSGQAAYYNGGLNTELQVTDNTFDGGGAINIGLRVLGVDNASITGNTLTGYTDAAIDVQYLSKGVSIENNDLDGNGRGVYVRGWMSGEDVAVHNNLITNNSTAGVENLASEAWPSLTSVDATYNWWGDVSGPYNTPLNTGATGNAVSADVNFMPWWGDEAMTTAVLAVQDNNITASNVRASRVNLSWTRGDGTGSFVVVRQGSPLAEADLPYSFTTYSTYNTAFNLAPAIGSAKIVQYGTSTICYMTGLTRLTPYYVRICGYIGDPSAGTAQFNRTDNTKLVRTPRAKESGEGTDALAGTFTVGQIAPNPVVDNISFTLDVSNEQSFTIEVYDAEGRVAASYCHNQNFANGSHDINMNLGNLANGLYTLVVKSGADLAITQFIISK